MAIQTGFGDIGFMYHINMFLVMDLYNQETTCNKGASVLYCTYIYRNWRLGARMNILRMAAMRSTRYESR